jgi:23S rRNA (uracil1939-C5)-methyltransferase
LSKVTVESLDLEGRGVAHRDGKAIFIEGALPGEVVSYTSFKRKPNYEIASVDRIFDASSLRVTPRCPHFGVCGGCSMQHIDDRAQVAAKQRVLEDTLWHIGRVKADRLLPPIYGESWGYRHRARLSVRHVPKKGGVLVGFHERRSSYVADMTSCAVLPERISRLLPRLRELIATLSIRDRIPQIELAIGDAEDVLVLRILEPLSGIDDKLLHKFTQDHGVRFFLQPKGPETASPLSPGTTSLYYDLPEFGVRFPFSPTEFTQVNAGINRVLVRRAVSLLAPRSNERIADFFCGLGNFTLPLARSGAYIIGIEGSNALVQRARENAALNGLAAQTEYRVANLFEATTQTITDLGPLDKILLDPPREGAIAVAKALPPSGIPRLVYVSCNPATLARDAAVLVHEQGYTLRAAGVVNMFPHTAHVESIALFEREQSPETKRLEEKTAE